MPSADGIFKNKKFAARFYGVSEATIDRWIASGKGPKYYKIGVQVRFKIDDLISYAEANSRGGQTARAVAEHLQVPA